MHGELYEVDDVMLSVLDDLEDHPTLYTRTPTLCHLLNKHTSPPSSNTAPHSSLSHTPTDVEVATTSASGSGLGDMKCEAYFIFNFNEKLLELPYLSCYDNETAGQTKYMTNENRENREEVKIVIYSELKQKTNYTNKIPNTIVKVGV